VNTFKARESYKSRLYSTIRSFFMHNRAELPKDPSFIIRGDVAKVRGTLTPEEIRQVVLASKPLYRAIILSMFQGGMGQEEFIYWSNNGWEKLKQDLNGDPHVIRVDLPGRKKQKNKVPYYTFIGSDAIAAIRDWVKLRPSEASAIFTGQYKDPITKDALSQHWNIYLKRTGIIQAKENGDVRNRYGKNLHELRDVFRSQWEKSPAKGLAAEYCMGHQVDPLEYNKAYNDENYTRSQYLRALPMLQLISSHRPFGKVDEDELESLRVEVTRLRAGKDAEVEALATRVRELESQIRREHTIVEEEKESIGALIKALTVRIEKLEKDPKST
jgi:integrase